MRHRYELVRESTRRKNKLTAISDELFPELAKIVKDPNGQVALALREHFPTPQALATASLIELKKLRGGARSFWDLKLQALQQEASESIGVKDLACQRGLILEQGQLIKELRLMQEHIDQLESEIIAVVNQSREEQILTSFPGFGPISRAPIIAAVGTIHNFSSASALKSYFGWAPVVAQSGSTLNASYLTPGGTRMMEQILYLAVLQIVRLDNSEWAQLYKRLVKAKCPFDERTQSYTGKNRVVGRVAGQLIEAIYAFLKRDAELLSHIPQGQEPPPPLLYDADVHQKHRQGQYRPLKMSPPPNVISMTQKLSPE